MNTLVGRDSHRVVQDLQYRIDGAATKDEALKYAIKAAELCMRALKIATSTDQKSELSSRCQSLLNEAEEIKHNASWRPSPKAQFSQLNLNGYSTPPRSQASIEQPTVARIKRLPEPIPTRSQSKWEQILILRASKLNGYTFPPWKGPPDPKEFHLKPGDKPFL